MRLTDEQKIKLRELRQSKVYKDWCREHNEYTNRLKESFTMCSVPEEDDIECEDDNE